MGFCYFSYYFKVLAIIVIFNILPLCTIFISNHLHQKYWMIITVLNGLIVLFFSLSTGLIVDKNYSIAHSLISSFHIVKKVYFKLLVIVVIPFVILGFMITIFIFLLHLSTSPYLSMFLAVIGMIFFIWYIIWCIMIQGMIYYQLIDQNSSLE